MAEIETNRDNKLCAKCQKPSQLFCSKCKVTPYCSMECQKELWKRHKTVCRLNDVTPPLTAITKIDDNSDFDIEYDYIVINSQHEDKQNTLSQTIGRIKGEIHPKNCLFHDHFIVATKCILQTWFLF